MIFESLAQLFSDKPKPTPLLLVMNFLKEHRCDVNYCEDIGTIAIAVRVLVATVRVESWFVLLATLRSALGAFIRSTMTKCTRGECVSGVFLMVTCGHQTM